MPRYGILCIALASGGPCPAAGQWLKSGDVEAHQGRGEAVFTDNAMEALNFATPTDAFAFWMRQSETQPIREDGQSNRPLMAFTVSIEKLPEPSGVHRVPQ